MLSGIKKHTTVIYGSLVLIGICIVLTIILLFSAYAKRSQVRRLHSKIGELQEQLVSAQITTNRLPRVQQLIAENLVYSSADTLAQGASLPFLGALTDVLDVLKISLVSLEPQPPVTMDNAIETPYQMTISCSFKQFCQLVNRMEKSSRLIAVKEFDIENTIDDYFDEENEKRCLITILISTLTLVRG